MIKIAYPIYPMKTDTPTKTIVKLEFAMHQLRTPTHKRGHLLGSPGMISCPTRVEKHKLNRNPWGQDGKLSTSMRTATSKPRSAS